MTVNALPRYYVRRCRCAMCYNRFTGTFFRDAAHRWVIWYQIGRNGSWRRDDPAGGFYYSWDTAVTYAKMYGDMSRRDADRWLDINDEHIVRSVN